MKRVAPKATDSKRAKAAELSGAWATLRDRLAEALGVLEEGQYLILSGARGPYYVQFAMEADSLLWGPVGAKLLEEKSRALRHGFERCIRPCLHTQCIRRTSFVANMFPNRIESDKLHGWKDQRSLTLQVTGSFLHFTQQQGQGLVDGCPRVQVEIGCARHQVFHLPSGNPHQVIPLLE